MWMLAERSLWSIAMLTFKVFGLSLSLIFLTSKHSIVTVLTADAHTASSIRLGSHCCRYVVTNLILRRLLSSLDLAAPLL